MKFFRTVEFNGIEDGIWFGRVSAEVVARWVVYARSAGAVRSGRYTCGVFCPDEIDYRHGEIF